MIKFNKCNTDKFFNVGVLCGGRSQGRTYAQFIRMYEKAKLEGFNEIKVNFIAPDIIVLKKDIETILNDIREIYLHMQLGKIPKDYEELLFQMDERLRAKLTETEENENE